MDDKTLNLLKVDTVIYPKKECKESAYFEDYENLAKQALENPEQFWAKIAEELHWFKKWEKVWNGKFLGAQWFIGGKINISYNCLDRNIERGLKNKVALIYTNEKEEERKITYGELYEQVGKLATALKEMRIKKGDRVLIYMPPTPEAIISMLACSRIGAIHSVVFAGFS
jgi:acetyl-CoA synthetase